MRNNQSSNPERKHPKDNKTPAKPIPLNPNIDKLEQPEGIEPGEIMNHVGELINEAITADLGTLLQESRVSPTEEIKPPQVAWKQVTTGAFIGTLGNISLIIGKAKSKKSFLVNIAISVVLNKDHLFGQFSGELPDGKKTVLYFDTEQSKYHVQLAVRRICDQIGIEDPANLQSYGLRKFTPTERLGIIEYAIETIPGVGFVVIDGVKDLISSINDEVEATMITSKLMKWSEEKGMHILSVLHQNKSDVNARGHIGTEMVNKSETVLSATVPPHDKDITIVQAEFCRNKPPEDFAFEINDNGLPVLVEDFEHRVLVKKGKPNVLTLPNHQLYQLLTEAFSQVDSGSLMYSSLVAAIKKAYINQHSGEIGTNAAKELVSYFKDLNWVNQESERKPYTLGQYENDH